MEIEVKRKEEDAEKKIFQKARSDGKDSYDKHIQELEKCIHEKLRIAHTSCVSSDEFLEKFLCTLIYKEKLEIGGSALQTGKVLDDASLLQKVFGGRALQGVLLTRNLKDQQERACQKVPENASIAGNSCLKEDIASFSSKHQEDSYRATGDILGHSIAVSAQVPVYGDVCVGGGVSESNRSEEESTSQKNKQKIYSLMIKYCSMNVASYTFGNSGLKLSDDANEDLKRIINTVKMASKSSVQRVCEKFFLTYGSHVNQGPLQFSESFAGWTYSSQGIHSKEIETVKKLQSEATPVSADVSFAGFGVSSNVSIDSIKNNYTSKCSKKTLASTQLVLDVNGGPTEVSDLSVWKAGLVANNSTWILTDRGSKLVAVWDVIGMNHDHQKEFGEVREVLRKAWEEMTGLQSVPNFMPNLKYYPADVLREVSEWNGKELTPRELEDNLHFLRKVKEDLLSKVHGTPTVLG